MRQQRWWGVIATLLLIVIAYADRVNISVMLVNPEFLHHFGLADNRAYQGTLMTAFLLGYGLSAMLLTPFGTVSSGFSVLVASQIVTMFAGGMLFIRMQGNRQFTTAW